MISLSYPSESSRWPDSGIYFSDWNEYSYALGYLCNPDHYRYLNNNGSISIHIEENQLSGAYAREGRIHYYGSTNFLETNLPAFDKAGSAVTGSIVCRINNNAYVRSLLSDFGFHSYHRNANILSDVIPPEDITYIVSTDPRIDSGEFDRGFNS